MCDKLFTRMLALIMFVPHSGSVQTTANETNYQSKRPAGFSSYEICIYQAYNHLPPKASSSPSLIQ